MAAASFLKYFYLKEDDKLLGLLRPGSEQEGS